MKRSSCMNCSSAELETFLDLGAQPNGNDFPTAETAGSERLMPISMLVCRTCWQVQIDVFPSPELLFGAHPYITGLNVPVVRHFEKMARALVSEFDLKPGALVLDIGCNDGSLLRCFQALGLRTLGIDPCLRTGELARAHGTTVERRFWNADTGSSLEARGIFPDLITATATFYHVPDLHDFIAGLKAVLRGKAVFAAQCVYLRDLIENNQFDHFYHEHSCIHSVAPLRRLFTANGLRLLHVEQIDIHGGSFIAYVGLQDHPMATRESVATAIAAEEREGLNRVETYHRFAERVRRNRDDLVSLLRKLKADGKRVFGLGSPVKGSTLLNYCGIGPDLIERVLEVNPFKIGRLTPGSHIPIVDEATAGATPDYYLVLTWNFLDFLVEKYRGFLAGGGRFIVPIPEVRVIGKEASARPSLGSAP